MKGVSSPRHIVHLVQANVAQRAIGPSTLRGQGRAGVVRGAREFLGRLDLRPFGAGNGAAFERELDRATERLRLALPRGAQHWGAARKALNIFLRDCADHHLLRARYALHRHEQRFEVPLDRQVALALALEPEGHGLPKWRTIKGLKPATSALYQHVALLSARRRGIPRVLLDAVFWRSKRLVRRRTSG
jgi:hypothetical protein